MKNLKIVKVVSLLTVFMLILSGCSGGSKKSDSNYDFTIGIVQYSEHPALDDARKGFEEGIKKLGVNANIVYQNAQGDIPTTMNIVQKFVKDKVDLIFAIATPAAQSAKQATSDIPILFSAVTDPVASELVNSMENPEANITGTSDLTPMDKQLQLFKDLNTDIKKVGIIFNTSEPNSQIQVEMAKELASSLNLEILDIGISTISDMPQAVDSIVKKVDGIYTITDNMVASAINIVAEKAKENNLITVGAEDAHIKGGILITDGISYYELGKQTSQMAKEILVDKKLPTDIPPQTSINTNKVFNENTLKSLSLDLNNEVFNDASKID